MLRSILILCLSILSAPLFSLSWDEPWQDEVMRESDYFILARVLDPKPGSVKIQVIKQFGDKKVEDQITLEGFHMLRPCANDTSSPSFFFTVIDTVYLFLKKKDIGYCIPTPTAGYAIVSSGKVLATFRHSFHQVQVSMGTYEKCMGAIWNSYKGLPYDKKIVTEYVEKPLKQKPAGFNEKEIGLFFSQHIALEMSYHLKLTDNFALVKNFVNCPNNHLMISAVQAMGNYETPEAKKMLVAFLKDPAKDNFTKVLAVKSLVRLNPKEHKAELRKIWETASQSPIAFSSNPSDPRNCTELPTLKDALQMLLEDL